MVKPMAAQAVQNIPSARWHRSVFVAVDQASAAGLAMGATIARGYFVSPDCPWALDDALGDRLLSPSQIGPAMTRMCRPL